ncbi:MAG: hypothetical protein ACYDBZ_20480 [Steroidobacteraceae bacterium]
MEGSTATGINLGINANTTALTGDFNFTGTAARATWTKIGAPNPANCAVTYTPAAVGGVPTITITSTTGC